MNLREDHIIRIKSSIEQDGEVNRIELMTRGHFTRRGNSFYISYQETETTGYEGCTTTLKVSDDSSKVTMLRYGTANTQLTIERGRRHVCHYETNYGSMTMGVTADEIACKLTEKGGTVAFSYLLDGGSADVLSKNALEITVTHIN